MSEPVANLLRMRRRVLPSVIIAVVALALTVAITVGWNIIFAIYYGPAFEDGGTTAGKVGYWLIMAVGDLFLIAVMTGIALVLTAAVRRTKALRRQDAFLDRITHELRTPITGLRLAIDTWQRRQLSAEALEELVRGMRDDLNRLNELVEHVLQTSSLEHGARLAGHEPCETVELLQHAATRIRRRHDIPEDAITVHTKHAPPRIFTDQVALEEIILNLLDNAVKYGGDEPNIELKAEMDAADCIISVCDHGIGIEPNQRSRIFKRFERGTEQPVQRRPGSGLGLYIVSELCRQIGGTINVDSAGKDQGSLFVVTIPIGDN